MSPDTAGRALPIATDRVTWREVRRVAHGHRLKLLSVAVIGLCSAAIGLVTPAALGRLIDEATAGTADLGTVVVTAVVMIAAAALGALGSAVTVMLAARSYQRMLAELRERLVARAMALPQHEVEQAGTGDLISRTNDDVTAIADAAPQIIAGFDLAGPRHNAVLDASWAVAQHSVRARTVQNMFFSRLNLAEYLGMAGILVVGFWLIGDERSTIGAATTAMLFFFRLFGPINQLLFVVDVLQSALASLNRIVGIITIDLRPDNSTVSEDDTVAARVEQVTHRYQPDGPAALDEVSLILPAGQRTAVVGSSGAGKTTLAAVIAGIHSPQSGAVTRPERTAVITQEAHVFVGTLRENLTLATPEATDEQIRAALHTTAAAGLLELLPDGLDTRVGGRDHDLTAAQAQQVALARLVLADPELAILDEATAEAGSAHAGLLDHAADAALTGRTGLVIAHRLTQAAACDRIVVMEHGRIVESGTHDELVAAGGVYADLWSAWQDGQQHASRHGPRRRGTPVGGDSAW